MLRRFQDDVAHWVITTRELEGIMRNLARDPLVGQPVQEMPGLLEYKYRSTIVTYAVSPDFREVCLLTARPSDIPLGAPADKYKTLVKALVEAGKIWAGRVPFGNGE
ncbi:hypothetical protein D6833_13855, partial [Candidatus Parcubacteria bacterium]